MAILKCHEYDEVWKVVAYGTKGTTLREGL